MASREFNLAKNWTMDRIIVLDKPTEKDNRLHGEIDKRTMLWKLRMDRGIVPRPFDQQFTSFTKLLAFVTEYYKKKNVNVVKVIDAQDSEPPE